jgi:hypothetical protein
MTDFYPQITVTSTPEPKQETIQQNPTPKKLGIAERREQTISLILQGMDITAIAKKLGVDRSTVYEDFDAWAKSEQTKYFQIEWLQQYKLMKDDDPQTAFEALTKLMMKLLEKQAKIEFSLTQNNTTTYNVDISTQVNELIKISRTEEGCKVASESKS